MSKIFARKLLNIGMLAVMAAVPSCKSDEAVLPGQVANYKYPSPAPEGGAIQTDVFRARISNSLFDFVTGHLGDIIGTVGGSIVTENGKKMAQIDLGSSGNLKMDISKLNQNTKISFDNAAAGFLARLNVELRDVDLYGDIVVDTCTISGKKDGPLVNVDKIILAIDLGITTNSKGLKVLDLKFSKDDSSINLGTGAIKGSVEGNGATCGLIQAALVIGDIITSVADVFSDIFMPELIKLASNEINNAIGDIPMEVLLGLNLPQTIAGSAGLDGLDSMWVYPQTFGAHIVGNQQPLRITQSGNDAMSRGLSIVIDAAFGSPKSECIGQIPPPQYMAMTTTLPDYNGKVAIKGASGLEHYENYDALVTISQASIAELLYGLIHSGAMCLRIDSDSLGTLIGGTLSPTVGLFAALAPELSYLAPSNAPVIISLRPTTAPVVKMGTGEQYIDDNDNLKIDSLVGIEFNELELNFFLFTENRYARMFTLLLDVHAGLTLTPTNDAKLKITVDELAIENFVTSFNDLAPHAKLDELLSTLLDTVVGPLLSNTMDFNVDLTSSLTKLFGESVDLFFNAIRREPAEPNPDLPGHYLAIYGTFCDKSDLNNTKDLACYRAGHGGKLPNESAAAAVAADAQLISNLDKAEQIYGYDLVGHPNGKLALDVTPGYEYSYKVNNGPWYSFRKPDKDGQLVIENGMLSLGGRHTVQLMARPLEGRQQIELEPIEVLVDVVRPNVYSMIKNDQLHIWADDMGTSPQDLRLSVRDSHDGEWHNIADLEKIIKAVRQNNSSLEVVAADEAGNVSRPLVVKAADLPAGALLGAPQMATENADEGKGGCNSTGNGSWLMLLALAAIILRKKTVQG